MGEKKNYLLSLYFVFKEFQFLVSMTLAPEENYQLVNNLPYNDVLYRCQTENNYQFLNVSSDSLPRPVTTTRVGFCEHHESIPYVSKSQVTK